VVLNLHHFPDSITSYFGDGHQLDMTLQYSFEEKLLGTAGGVRNNDAFLGVDTFLVMSGDALTDMDLSSLVAAHHATGALATIAVQEVADPSQYGVVVTNPDGRIVGFQEKPSREKALSRLCNCGVYVFQPEVMERIPRVGFYDFGSQLFPAMVAAGEALYAHRVAGYWSDVGNLAEYRRGNYDALEGRVRVERPGRLAAPGVWLGERTYVAPTALISGPVLIGDDCRIEEDVTLEGPLVIGDQSLIERESLLRSGISWGGLYVGEGCTLVNAVLGRNVHLRGMVQADGAVLGERCLVGHGRSLGARVLKPRAVVWR